MVLIRGQLAAASVAGSATLTDVYTVPTGSVSDVNITIVNRVNSATTIRLAHIKSGTSLDVADEDYLIYNLSTSEMTINLAPITATGILMSEGDTIAVYSSATSLSVQINGIEETP